MSVGAAPPVAAPQPAAAPGRANSGWVDRFVGSDPGLTRLLTALQVIVTIAVAMLAEWIFVRGTHALLLDSHGAELDDRQAALVAAQHHAMQVVAIMLGAMMGMMASFSASMFPTMRSRLANMLLMPVPMAVGMALGLALGPHRKLALASLIVVLAMGAYARRFGPTGLAAGLLLFMGDFFGFFLHAEISLRDLGWLTAEAAIGALVAVIAQASLFYPSSRRALRRMVRSYAARARSVSAGALELFDRPTDQARLRRRLERRLVRLNEAALMIDAQLDDAAVSARRSAATIHQLLFDAELALTNTARMAARIAELDVPAPLRDNVRASLAAVACLDLTSAELAARELLAQLREPEIADSRGRSAQVVLYRFATSVLGFVTAAQTWRSGADLGPRDAAFVPSVLLFGGWLPGSAVVSAEASLERGERFSERLRLAPYTRVAIQMAVAATGTVLLGDLLNGRRFYWAVLAAFVMFMGANNAGEQLRKGFYRVLGTLVGVLLGAIGAHLVGNRTGPAIAVILVALFVGLYLMRVSYVFLVIAITVMVSQLYVQLDEFSDALLRLRLEETALGAGITALTVLCVVPLRTGRVARLAARRYFEQLAELIGAAVGQLARSGDQLDLRAATRRLDGAYQSLTTTLSVAPTLLGNRPEHLRAQLVQTVNATRFYARNLVADVAQIPPLIPQLRDMLLDAGERLVASVGEIVAASQHRDAHARSYVRAAALFDVIATSLPDAAHISTVQLALRDLQLLDGAAAGLAEALGMTVQALDTAGSIDSVN